MPRVRDGRLARLTAESTRLDSTAGLDNWTLRAWNTVRAAVRDGLLRAGVDPACAAAMRESGAGQMTDVGDGIDVWRGETEPAVGDHDGLADALSEKIRAVARRFEDGREPDFASASLAELLAWCLYRKGPCDP